jgi:hypothetical protein
MFFLHAESEALQSTAERREVPKRFRGVPKAGKLLDTCRRVSSGDAKVQVDLTVCSGEPRKSSEDE